MMRQKDMPELFRDDEPAVPDDLSGVPADTLFDWRSVLDRIILSIQAQISERRRVATPDGGYVPASPSRGLFAWKAAARKKLASLNSLRSRLKDEIRRRSDEQEQQKGNRRRVQLYPAMKEFALAVAAWPGAPAGVIKAAVHFAELITDMQKQSKVE